MKTAYSKTGFTREKMQQEDDNEGSLQVGAQSSGRLEGNGSIPTKILMGRKERTQREETQIMARALNIEYSNECREIIARGHTLIRK